jgi:hypothetical protein
MGWPLTVTDVDELLVLELEVSELAADWLAPSLAKGKAGDDSITWALEAWLGAGEALTKYLSNKIAATKKMATAAKIQYLPKGKTAPTLTMIPLKPLFGWTAQL